MQSKEGKSVLTYTPVSDVDYGTLYCRASNLAGQQVLPCVYTLLPATRPEAPYNCTVYNLTDDSLDLVCSAGEFNSLRLDHFINPNFTSHNFTYDTNVCHKIYRSVFYSGFA